MPCATIHLLLADRAIEAWRAGPGQAPFPVQKPGLTEAFFHGALAPDMGFVPGVDRLLSELSHYHSSGDLARALLTSARGEEEVAFTWGWISHVLGDVALHPLIGRACGELLHGDRDLRMNAADDLPTHVGIEVGLDMIVLTRDQAVSRPPSRPGFPNGAIHHFTDALRATYGISWDRKRILAHHGRSVRMTARWPGTLRAMARRALWTRPIVAAARRATPSGSAIRGFFTPILPPKWVVEEVDAFARIFPELLQEQTRSGLAGLGNFNLETGLDERESLDHPGAIEARARLLERQLLGTAY